MSDYPDCTSSPPDRKQIILAIDQTYNAVFENLFSAGQHLSDIADLVDGLDDGQFVSLPFLLARQLEIVRMATNWVMQTKKNLRAMEGDHDAN